MFSVPPSLQRLADQIDGWLDLRCPDQAIELLGPMLADPAGRDAGLEMRIRALARLGEFAKTLPDLEELRGRHPDDEWVDLTEAWCKKRTGDLRGAVTSLERALARDHKSDTAHFNLGCYLALLGERDRAIDEVTLACGINEDCRDFARDDPDLDSLRADPRFRALLREERPARADAPATDDDDDDDGPGADGPRDHHRRN